MDADVVLLVARADRHLPSVTVTTGADLCGGLGFHLVHRSVELGCDRIAGLEGLEEDDVAVAGRSGSPTLLGESAVRTGPKVGAAIIDKMVRIAALVHQKEGCNVLGVVLGRDQQRRWPRLAAGDRAFEPAEAEYRVHRVRRVASTVRRRSFKFPTPGLVGALEIEPACRARREGRRGRRQVGWRRGWHIAWR